MKRSILIKGISGVINLITGLISALVVLVFQDWFGSNDIFPFLLWTVPLAIAFSVSGESILGQIKTKRFFHRSLFIFTIAVFVSIGWVLGVYLILGSWIYAFSIPVFYLWIIGITFQLFFLDYFHDKTNNAQKKINLLPPLLSFSTALVTSTVLLILVSFVSMYTSRPEKKTFFIPNEFEGLFRVVYGENCGVVPPLDSSGRLIIQVPEIGILIIQNEFKGGIIDHEYFFLDDDGHKEKLDMIFSQNGNHTGVKLGGMGVFPGPMPDGSYSTESQLTIRFSNFYVYNHLERSKGIDYSTENQRIDTLTRKLVSECRDKVH